MTRVILFWNAVETATPADAENPDDPAYVGRIDRR